MRIGLIGHFGAGNLGNDGSLEAVLQMLRRQQRRMDIVAYCANPEPIATRLQVAAAPYVSMPAWTGWRRTLNRVLLGLPGQAAKLLAVRREVRTLDALIVPGTGILDDFGTGARGMPAALLRWVVLARLNGVKVCLLAIGAGPIHRPVSRWLMRWIARLATFRSFRDAGSRAFVASLGIDTSKDEVWPDVAFALPPPSERPTEGRRDVVGVGVMAYNGWHWHPTGSRAVREVYLDRLTTLVAGLIHQDKDVRLLIGAKSDLAAVNEVLKRLARLRSLHEADRLVAEPAQDLKDVMRQVAGCDLVIASRYHNVVCALAMGRPVISLGYAIKNEALMTAAGLADYCQSIEAIDIGLLERQITRLMDERPAATRRVEAAIASFRQRLIKVETALPAVMGIACDTSRPLDAAPNPQSPHHQAPAG